MTAVTIQSQEEHTKFVKRTRNTVQRRAVLEAVRALGATHPTAADIFTQVRRSEPNLSLATVYRALDALVEQHEIGRSYIEQVARYDVSPLPHHHIVCRLCNNIVDMESPLPLAAVRRLKAASKGFALDLDAIQFTGVCPNCSNTTNE